MFAVIRTGGKQYRVAAEDVIKVEKVKGDPGEIVQFGEVLVVGGDDVTLGVPDHCRRLRGRRGPGAGARRQGHRLQEAPAQEFAPQARPPPGVHPAAGDRDPDRRRQADRHRAAQARARSRSRRWPTADEDGDAEDSAAPKAKAAKKPAKAAAKKPAAKADKPKSGAKGKKK